MRIAFIALLSLFSLVIASSVPHAVGPTQGLDDCPPDDSGNDFPPINGQPSPDNSVPATPTTQITIPTTIGNPVDTDSPPAVPGSIIPGGIIPSGVVPSGLPDVLTGPAQPARIDEPFVCNGGSAHCCNDVYDSKTFMGKDLARRMNIPRGPSSSGSLFGLQCSPVTWAGGGGVGCSSQTICCDNTYMEGFIVFGCNTFNFNA